MQVFTVPGVRYTHTAALKQSIILHANDVNRCNVAINTSQCVIITWRLVMRECRQAPTQNIVYVLIMHTSVGDDFGRVGFAI